MEQRLCMCCLALCFSYLSITSLQTSPRRTALPYNTYVPTLPSTIFLCVYILIVNNNALVVLAYKKRETKAKAVKTFWRRGLSVIFGVFICSLCSKISLGVKFLLNKNSRLHTFLMTCVTELELE